MSKYKFVGNPKKYSFKVKLRKGEEYLGDTVVIALGNVTLQKLIEDSQKDVERVEGPFLRESTEFLNDWKEL